MREGGSRENPDGGRCGPSRLGSAGPRRSSRMNRGVRAGLLTPYGPSRAVGGVEVFNECLRRAVGEVEIFSGDHSEAKARFGDLRRVGVVQPAGGWRGAPALPARPRPEAVASRLNPCGVIAAR